jgi:O-antigen/teichoic acid export membrane protein
MSGIRTRKKTTIWNLAFQYINISIGLVRGFLLVPLYLVYIENELYGAWLATGNILMWLSISDPGVGVVLQQRVAESYGKKNKEELQKNISSGIFSGFFIALIVLIVGLLLSTHLCDILNLPNSTIYDSLEKSFRVAVYGSCLLIFSFVFHDTNAGLQSSKSIGLFDVIVNLLAILVTVLMLIGGYGILAMGYSILTKGAGNLITNSIYLLYRMRKERIRMSFELVHFFSFIKIFIYTFFSKAFITIAENIDLVLISRWISPEMVVVYELTRRPVKMARLFADRPAASFLPTFSNLFGTRNYDKLRNVFTSFVYYWSWITFIIIGGFITFNGALIELWVGKEFYLGDTLNSLMCMMYLISSFSYSIGNFSFAMGNIKGNSIAEGIGSIVWVFMLFLLGRELGLIGFILAPIIAKLSCEFWYFPSVIIKKIKYRNIEINRLLRHFSFLVSVNFVLVIFFIQFKTYNWYSLIIMSVTFSIIYFGLNYFLSTKFKGELNYLIQNRKFKLQ